MSNATTRFEYAYIEVKHDAIPKSVTLYGPAEVLYTIQGMLLNCASELLGATMKITMTARSDTTFAKAAFVHEILKHGFVYSDTPSNFKDDFIIFSRQVKL